MFVTLRTKFEIWQIRIIVSDRNSWRDSPRQWDIPHALPSCSFLQSRRLVISATYMRNFRLRKPLFPNISRSLRNRDLFKARWKLLR